MLWVEVSGEKNFGIPSHLPVSMCCTIWLHCSSYHKTRWITRAASRPQLCCGPCQNISVCATKDHCSLTYTLPLSSLTFQWKKRQHHRNIVTGWNYQLWVLVCLMSASQSTQWASFWCKKSQTTLICPSRDRERSWKERNSSSWVQSCQSKRWDKNLHLYTELTVSTMQSPLYRWFTDKIRYRDGLSNSLS